MKRSKAYMAAVEKIDAANLYAPLEAVRLVKETTGTKFDPNIHQAISMVPAEQEANTVVGVLQKGYLISDRVLRPALVTVAAPK